jgi:hypothetical protein
MVQYMTTRLDASFAALSDATRRGVLAVTETWISRSDIRRPVDDLVEERVRAAVIGDSRCAQTGVLSEQPSKDAHLGGLDNSDRKGIVGAQLDDVWSSDR